MPSVTLHFTGLDESGLRKVLVAHHQEHKNGQQPTSLASAYAQEHDAGRVGCIVRVEGTQCYTVTTMPLDPESASRVAFAAAVLP